MKKPIDKIKIAMTIFDIGIIFAIACIAFFSIFSYYNIEITKTEDYLKQFLLALKVVYYLGIIAFAHMFFSLIYSIYKKAKGQNGI